MVSIQESFATVMQVAINISFNYPEENEIVISTEYHQFNLVFGVFVVLIKF